MADGWVGFKEGAPSPQFAGPRWGCSQIAPLLQHWGPLSGPGRQPAAPEATGALRTGSGECRYLRVHVPEAGAGCAWPAAAECVYIWGHAEEVEPSTWGGRRDQPILLPLPHPQDRDLNRIPAASSPPHSPQPTPTLVLLLPPAFRLRTGLGERRVRSAPPSLRTVWLPPPLGSSRRPLPAGAAEVAVLGSSALEEGGAHVEESVARFGGRGDAAQKMLEPDRKSTRLNSSHRIASRMPSSA